MRAHIASFAAIVFSGCATIDFNADSNGAVYYEPVPYIFYTRTDKCIDAVTAVTLPGAKRHLDFRAGYGSSNLSADFSNGLLVKVGQSSNNHIPETLTSIAAVGKSFVATATPSGVCEPKAVLYPVVDGIPDLDRPYELK